MPGVASIATNENYFGAPDAAGGATTFVPGLVLRLEGALSIGPGPLPPGMPTPDEGELADGPGWPGAPVVAVLGGAVPGDAAVPCAIALVEPAITTAAINAARASMVLRSLVCLCRQTVNERGGPPFPDNGFRARSFMPIIAAVREEPR
jgi:hypothetical protein